MPLSEELRDQIARIIDPGVAMMLFDHGHRNQWGHESWEKTLSKADQILVLLERAKAQALGGGKESGSSSAESGASVLTDLTEQQRGASLEWRPIASAPRDGTRILTWCVHRNATYSKDPIGEGWAAAVIAEWTDFNGGGWVWHGLCGEHTLWQPLPRPPAESGLSGRQGSEANTSAGTEALDEH